ncbi:MAG: tetratricopeptide repeat protein [Deltaproteobacteria bacterium]|nr:tetratricopeptide repeat protein [Deltaproteobacteria bacterium]
MCPRRIHVLAAVVALVATAADPAAFGHAPPEAIEAEARAAIARHPADADAHLAAGRMQRAARAWDAALAAFARAAELGADPSVVAVATGQVCLDAGWPRLAERAFTRALERTPEDLAARYDRGRARMALGDPAGAARDFERAIARMREPRPEHVFAWRDARIALGDRAGAIRVLDAGIAHLGAVPSLQLAALDLELALGRYPDALRRLDALLATGAQSPVWVARRAEVLDRLARRDDARRERARALAMIERRRPERRGAALTGLAADLRRDLATTELQEDHP